MPREYFTININELDTILSRYCLHPVTVEYVDVDDGSNQFDPKHLKIGVGGVLTLYLKDDE